MIAFNYYDKEQEELLSALESALVNRRINEQNRKDIQDFFTESKKMEYNEFLIIYDEKYGKIIKQYREREKVQTMKILYYAAILYIITFILGIIGVILFLANSTCSGY